MKRTIAIALTTVLTASSLLTACSSTSEQGSEAASKGNPSSTNPGPATLNVFVSANDDTDIKTNTFTKFAAEKFNINFKWQAVPKDAVAEKRQIALASGDYPDLFLLITSGNTFSQTDLIRYGKQGVILPLNQLIESYAPNIKKALTENSYYKKMVTAPDGNIYGLNQFNECYHCSFPNKLWINSDFLKKLNLEMPKTVDDFKKVMQAFKTKDPNGNGKADEIPLSGANGGFGQKLIPFFMNAFIYNDDNTYLLLKNGKVDLAANKEEWKQGLAYIKSMYDEGLIDPGAFTQNNEAYKKLGDNAGAEILGAGTIMHPNAFVTAGTERSKHYDALPPLQGPQVKYATLNYANSAGATFVLTNKASKEAQIAAIKLVDYMFTTEGQIRANFGEKGINWDDPKPGDEGLGGAKALYAKISLPPGSPPTNTAWGGMAQYYQPKTFRDVWASSKKTYEQEGYERRLHEATGQYDGNQPKELFPYWALWIDPAVADEAAMLRQNLNNYIDQNALQFITGSKDMNKGWDAYVKGFDGLNLKRYMEIMQQSYDDSLKK